MSQKEKLLLKIINNPNDVRFDDLCNILNWRGWVVSTTSSSHYTYEKKENERVVERVTIVKRSDGKVLPCYVREVLKRMGEI